jgi:hypothetical protein
MQASSRNRSQPTPQPGRHAALNSGPEQRVAVPLQKRAVIEKRAAHPLHQHGVPERAVGRGKRGQLGLDVLPVVEPSRGLAPAHRQRPDAPVQIQSSKCRCGP